MDLHALDSLRRRARGLLAERHIFIRTRRRVRGFIISPRQQLIAAAAIGVLGLWTVTATVAATVATGREAAAEQHHRRLAATQTNAAIVLAAQVEARQAALAHLLAASESTDALAPVIANPPTTGRDPLARIAAVDAAEGRAIDAADALARLRAEQFRRVLRAAGIDPGRTTGGEGGPLIRPGDPIARLAGSDEAFFAKAARAATSLAGARRLAETARDLPLGRPVASAAETSGFGARADPFTGEAAFHAGQDFAAPMYTPIAATGAGVVSFAGERSGYGNAVEITHANGLMTRYGHLAAIHAHVGEPVSRGQVIGALGSTGRSTGPHLHYEVWLNGRAENPMRFVHAGDELSAN